MSTPAGGPSGREATPVATGTLVRKAGGPGTKRVLLGPEGKPVSDNSGCTTDHGEAERVELDGGTTTLALRQQEAGVARKVKLAEPWQRESARGTVCFSGLMSDARELLFAAREREHRKGPGEMVRVWRLMVQERDPSRRPGGGR